MKTVRVLKMTELEHAREEYKALAVQLMREKELLEKLRGYLKELNKELGVENE